MGTCIRAKRFVTELPESHGLNIQKNSQKANDCGKKTTGGISQKDKGELIFFDTTESPLKSTPQCYTSKEVDVLYVRQIRLREEVASTLTTITQPVESVAYCAIVATSELEA